MMFNGAVRHYDNNLIILLIVAASAAVFIINSVVPASPFITPASVISVSAAGEWK